MSARPPPPRRPLPPPPPTDLTPLRAHYLKKSLVTLQLRKELADLTAAPNPSTLAYLGPPFAPPQHPSPRLDLPLLKYVFRHYVLSFPFMAAAPNDFYSDKLQPFADSLFARNLSSPFLLDDSDPQDPASRKLIAKVERSLAMFITSAVKLVEPEDVLRLSQADLQALERAVNKRLAKHNGRNSLFHVNIVSVRAVTERGRVRSRVHEEFIICTTLSHDRRVCVSRRYGDFKTLENELRKAHPDSIVPSPPLKDRTAVDIPVSPTTFAPTDPGFSSEDPSQEPTFPGNFYPNHMNKEHTQSRLSREKNRLTLRAYLHTLLASPPFSSSPVLHSFLFSGPTRLSPQEEEDARRREEADRVRAQGKKEFAREIGMRVDQLREAVRTVKGEIVGRDGLSRVFAVIKVTPDVKQLPDNYQAVLEWARISLASTIFHTFVASDNASETFASLKRVHGLMPYFLLKAALKISNPVAMIRNVLDIFLAQPFGGRSLLQRMCTSSLTEEVRTLNTYIEHVSAKIDSPVLCEKVRLFVYAPREIQETYRVNARYEHTHLLRAILMGGQEPVLSRSLAGQVDRAWRKWAVWMAERKREGKGKLDESDSEEGPTDEEAWLFEDSRVLLKLYSRLRDREQLIALIFEGVTAELLKDIITIFYTPLAQVYKAANIAESLGDLQHFINDLIRTVEQAEDFSQPDASFTVQAFIDLVNRHEQSFYTFVHKVHSKGQGLFESLMKWIERFLTAVREGIGASDLGGSNNIVLETMLPAGDEERVRIMEEVDKVMRWHYLNKIAHEEKLRSRFRLAQKDAEADADAEDEATRVLIDGVAKEFDFGDLVRANVDELAAEESDSDDDDDEDSDDHDEEDDDIDDDTSNNDASNDETDSNETEERMNPQTRFVHSSTIRSLLSRAETTEVAARAIPQEASGLSRSQTSLPSPTFATGPSSVSLRSTKSMQLPRKLYPSIDIPPVPMLPVHLDKPLPPRPPRTSSVDVPRRRSIGQLASPEPGPSGDDHPTPTLLQQRPHKPRKKAPAQPQPPELKYIPMLLPIFVEMLRPLLRSQR